MAWSKFDCCLVRYTESVVGHKNKRHRFKRQIAPIRKSEWVAGERRLELSLDCPLIARHSPILDVLRAAVGFDVGFLRGKIAYGCSIPVLREDTGEGKTHHVRDFDHGRCSGGAHRLDADPTSVPRVSRFHGGDKYYTLLRPADRREWLAAPGLGEPTGNAGRSNVPAIQRTGTPLIRLSTH